MDFASWHGVFWLVAPVGALSLLLMIPTPEPPRERQRHSIDVLGAVLLAASLFALAISFNHLHDGPETFQAGWMFHTGAQATALVLFVAFLVVERSSREPLIRLEYLQNMRFGAAVGANGIFHMTMMATMFLTPFLFERGWGLTTTHSSIVMGVLQAVNISTALAAGWVVDRWRLPHLPAISLAGIATGMLLLGFLGQYLTYPLYLVVTLLLGVSSGFFNTSNNTIIMSILPDDSRGFAAGMLETTRQFGHTVAVSLAAVAMGLAGVSLRGAGSPEAMVAGFQLSVIIMGSIAAGGVILAAVGQVQQHRERAVRQAIPGAEPQPIAVP
jgi:MFS family permease